MCSSQTVAGALPGAEGPDERKLGAQARLNINLNDVSDRR